MNINFAVKELSELAKKYAVEPTIGYDRRLKDKIYIMLTQKEAKTADWIPKTVHNFPVVIRIMGTIIAA